MPRRAELTISKRTIDGLAVEGKDAVFRDRELAGFGVRVYPSGRKIYVVQSRKPGRIEAHDPRPTWRTHRRAGAQTGCCRHRPHQKGREPGGGTAGARVHRGRSGTTLPGDACGGKLQRAHRGDLPRIARQPHPAGAGNDTDRFGRPEASALHFGLRDTPRAANRALMVLSEMFSLAEAWPLQVATPAASCASTKEGMRERFLTPDEYRRLGRALCSLDAGGPLPARVAAALRLLVATGCRLTEILSPAMGRRGTARLES